MYKFRKCIFVGIAIPEVPVSGFEEESFSLSRHIESVYILQTCFAAHWGLGWRDRWHFRLHHLLNSKGTLPIWMLVELDPLWQYISCCKSCWIWPKMNLKVAFDTRIVFLNFSSVYVLAYFFELTLVMGKLPTWLIRSGFLKRNKKSSNYIANFQ